MSPNNKQNLSKDLENEIQNANLNQFAQFSSEEDDDQVITNGYVLLNQDLEQTNGDRADDSSDFESDSSDEEIPADQLNQMVRCSVNIDFQEAENDEEDRQEEADRLSKEDSWPAGARFKSYLDGQLQGVPFEREYDKKETQSEQQNAINMDKDNIDQIKECMKNVNLPSSSIPKWAKLSDSELTSFIYKRLEQAKR